MNQIKITSSNGQEYTYDDDSGFLYPKGMKMYPVGHVPLEPMPKATCQNLQEYLSAYGFRQLLLEVTQKCNMRCRYCTYSDHYENTRSHGFGDMAPRTALAAVDYYMECFTKTCLHNPLRDPMISFYGGEPLLNLELIKTVVKHVEEKYNQFTPTFSLTVNGLLLTEEVGDYLARHGFSIIVSLDGDQENHDRNRRRPDGRGTFLEVLHNVEAFRKRRPDHSRLGVSTCIDYRTDLEAVDAFFREQKLFITMINMVSPNETDYYDDFTTEEIKGFQSQMADLKEKYRKLALTEGIIIKDDTFLLALFGLPYVEVNFHSLIGRGRPDCLPCTGSCIPGEKIYVTIDGTYHMCERINPGFPIGNVNTGLDLSAISEYVNQLNAFAGRCRTCNVGRMCNICYARATDHGKLIIPEEYCKQQEQHIGQTLREYADFMEANPNQMETVLTSYYKEMKAVAGTPVC